MSQGISFEEACNVRVMSDDALSRICPAYSNHKNQTIFILKNDSSQSFTVDHMVLQTGFVGVILLVVLLAWMLEKRRP